MRSLVSDGVCKQHTAQLASFTTHAIFLVCTWLKFWSPALGRIFGLLFLRVVNVVPSQPCFTAPCLTHSCLRTSHLRFLRLHLVRLRLLRCYVLRRVHPLPLCKGGYALANWLNNPSHRLLGREMGGQESDVDGKCEGVQLQGIVNLVEL